MMSQSNLPFLDIVQPDFSTRGPAVIEARRTHWCARTPFGLAVVRHRQAGFLLRDKRLRQGSYAWPDKMGLNGSFSDFWRKSVIGQEGDGHRRLRSLVVPALSEEFIASLVPGFDRIAAELVEGIIQRTRTEFMEDFATPFAGRAICTLLAIDDDHWPQVAGDASSLGLAMGLNAKTHEPRFDQACDRLMERADHLLDRAYSDRHPRGYVGRLVLRAQELGTISREELQNLIVISIFGGVDTTRAQLGFLVDLFIANPDQWQALRGDPGLAAAALEESLRHHPTTTWSTREAIDDFTFDGIDIKKGQTVHIFAHATGTDPAIAPDADFDITRRRKTHFGFGGGAHNCLGQAVARSDISSALRAMAARISAFEYDGTPEWLPDSGNTAPHRLPLKVHT